jgi:hypothetical protein
MSLFGTLFCPLLAGFCQSFDDVGSTVEFVSSLHPPFIGFCKYLTKAPRGIKAHQDKTAKPRRMEPRPCEMKPHILWSARMLREW